MSIKELKASVTYWIKAYSFCDKVAVETFPGSTTVSFVARTTSSRSSSMVTRLQLMCASISSGGQLEVHKTLVGEAPEDRAALASWRISVTVVKKQQNASIIRKVA